MNTEMNFRTFVLSRHLNVIGNTISRAPTGDVKHPKIGKSTQEIIISAIRDQMKELDVKKGIETLRQYILQGKTKSFPSIILVFSLLVLMTRNTHYNMIANFLAPIALRTPISFACS